MEPAILLILLFSAAASSVGGLLLCLRRWSEDSLLTMISIGAGLLLAITLLDMLPHSVGGEHQDLTPFVLFGFALLFVLEFIGQNGKNVGTTSVMGVLSGFLLHAFVEGVSLMASFRLDPALGVSILLALLLHKVPDGVTVASLLLAATRSRVKALWGAIALGIATVAGALCVGVAERFLPPVWSPVMLAVTTGIFLYVSASHLVPLIQHTRRVQLGISFFAAMLAYLLISIFLHGKLHVHA